MDVLLIQASVYELPTSRRVGVIVHDGPTDALLWPGPGPDRELLHAYGGDLQKALDRERSRLPQKSLNVGELLRLHPGKLHCDFFLWIATRGPEQEGRQAPAPDKETLDRVVRTALDYCAERHVIRVALPALGAGPSSIEDGERLATVASAAHAWHEDRFRRGLASGIEEVMVCDPRLSVVSSARRRVGSIAKAPPGEPKPASVATPEKRTAAKKPGASKAAAPPRRAHLEPGEISHARATAKPWDRTIRYSAQDWFIHAKFGVGRVNEVTPDGFIIVLFEDGETRKLVHARS